MRARKFHQWTAAVAAGLVTALVTGLPTEMIGNPWFVRMTPVLWWNRPVWVLTAVLAVGAMVLLAVALRARLRSAVACPTTVRAVVGAARD